LSTKNDLNVLDFYQENDFQTTFISSI
jgi:hypothetical protein